MFKTGGIMLTTNFLKTRTSTREFKDSKIGEDKIKKIYETVTDLKNRLDEEDLDYQIEKNGDAVYEKLNGKAGYKGVMIKAPLYIGLDYRK